MMQDPRSRTILHPIAPDRAKSYAAQIVDALEHCYRNGVVHRDVKLGNILIHKEESGLERVRSDIVHECILDKPIMILSLTRRFYPTSVKQESRRLAGIWTRTS